MTELLLHLTFPPPEESGRPIVMAREGEGRQNVTTGTLCSYVIIDSLDTRAGWPNVNIIGYLLVAWLRRNNAITWCHTWPDTTKPPQQHVCLSLTHLPSVCTQILVSVSSAWCQWWRREYKISLRATTGVVELFEVSPQIFNMGMLYILLFFLVNCHSPSFKIPSS